MAKKIRYLIEAILFYFFYYILKIFSFSFSSKLMGGLVRFIGPKLKQTRIAKHNIRKSIPELSEDEIENLIPDIWESLGRIAGEFVNVYDLSEEEFKKHVTVKGLENVRRQMDEKGQFLIVTAHIGNWEIIPKVLLMEGMPIASVYRKANNPFVDKMIIKTRLKCNADLFPKGREGVKNILKHIKNKGSLGMLVDQKMNNGIAVPFFGREAMTAPAIAELALKFNLPLIPARVKRTEGANFELIFYPPIDVQGKDVLTIMTKVNSIFEEWIKKKPAQWFWVHKRWDKQEYKKLK